MENENNVNEEQVRREQEDLELDLKIQDEIEEEREQDRREQEDQERDLERQEELDEEYGDGYKCMCFCGDKEEPVLER
jgi:hypothetical protein